MRIAADLDFTTVQATRFAAPTVSEVQSNLILFMQMLRKLYRNLATAFNGNIGFGTGTVADNINGVWETVTFPTLNTNVTVTHNLGRIPVGYIVMTKSQAGDIFTGSVAATKTQITLQCSTSGQIASLFIV